MVVEIIECIFVAACRQLWADYVGNPDHHLWALAIIRASEGKPFGLCERNSAKLPTS